MVELINDLTSRRMPLIIAIVKNLAEEIRGCTIGKNWTASFVERYKYELKSLYLKSIDNKRIKGEYSPAYKHFYQLVKLYSILLLLLYSYKPR